MTRENNFGMLRILAALMVISGHMYVLMGVGAPVMLFRSLHELGILMFFLVGGYLITSSWKNDRNYLRYLVKRFFRILPPIVFYVFFTACIIGPIFTNLPLGEYFGHVFFLDYFKNIALNVQYFLPGVFEENIYPNVVNGSLWSLPIEACMYFLIPIIYEVGKKLDGKVHLLITASVCVISLIQGRYFLEWHFIIYEIDLAQALHVVPFYLLGSLAAVWKIKKEMWSIHIAVIMIFAAQAFQGAGIVAGYILSYVVIPYVIFSFAFGMEPVKSKIFLKIQETTYGMYLYGFLVQQIVVHFCVVNGLAFTVTKALLLSVAGTLGMAFLNHILIEKPSQKICKKVLLCLKVKNK